MSHNLIAVLLLTLGLPAVTFAEAKAPADLILVLATDVSGSISSPLGPGGLRNPKEDIDEYKLQKDGITKVLRDQELAEVIEQCATHGAAIAYVEWSGSNGNRQVKQVVPWFVIKNRKDMAGLAAAIDKIEVRSFNAETDVAGAIEGSTEIIAAAPFESGRRIISISSDGKQNVGPSSGLTDEYRGGNESEYQELLKVAREKALAQDVTIDALVILNDSASHSANDPLDLYYEHNVIGGPGGFTVPVHDFDEYADGLKRKLMRELNSCIM